jgi:hypothetical protein
MTVNRYAADQPPAATGAGLWRTACRTARALRAIHHEQVLMWELFYQVGRRLPAPDDAGARAGHTDPARDSCAPAYRRPVRP